MGRPTVFPTGTTLYDPDRCQNGYTLFTAKGKGVVLVNMNGKVVHSWRNVLGMPSRMLPGGYLLGSLDIRDRAFAFQDMTDVSLIDWDGRVKWSFTHNQQVVDGEKEKRWVARQHHDYQVAGNPVGYWVPGMESSTDFDTMLILTHNDVRRPKISPQLLLEDRLIEIDRAGNITWEWCMLDHFDEFGFDETARNAIFRNPNTRESGPEGEGDVFHVNCSSYLGPNKWYDAGDERFNPYNIIMSSREASFLFIVDHETGKVVWQVGPSFDATHPLRIMGTIIGPHCTHMIPQGLPGAGNILLYDNGGWGHYGAPSQISKTGMKVARRDSSRVLEFDPCTLEVIWECRGDTVEGGSGIPFRGHFFYSPLTSNAQRLPNGNTFVCEGATNRLMEFTPEGNLVWEYLYPYAGNEIMYRAYRIPYEWAPQLSEQKQIAIPRIDNAGFLMPGAEAFDFEAAAVDVDGAQERNISIDHCVDVVR